jgi:ATP/maltotriose-dependent transcriptional regulator MalT
MKKQTILFGAILALLTILIKWLEYRFVMLNYTVEVYGSALAVIFTIVGIWAGRKLTERKTEIIREEVIVDRPVYIHIPSSDSPFPKTTNPEDLGISKREMEILQLMAQGFSNQEIAEKIFLSIHTIKTHASNLFVKLDAKRRTQAISRAKELGLIS